MAKAVFACEEVKKFPDEESLSILAHPDAIFPRFAENLFVCDRPGHGSNRYCQNKEPNDLGA